MISLGVDGASTCTGVALAVDGQVVHVDHWRPRGPLAKGPATVARMLDFHDWLGRYVSESPAKVGGYPDKAYVELASNVRGPKNARPNTTTIRVLGWWEAASFTAISQFGLVAEPVGASSARASVFPGHGRDSKEQIGELMAARFPEITFAKLDESDAGVQALVAWGKPPKKK